MIEAADEIAGVVEHIEAERNRIRHAPYSLSLPEDDKLRRAAFESADEVWITAWLRNEKTHATAVTIGARTALRVVPLVGLGFEKRSEAEGKAPTSGIIGSVFRACTVALVGSGHRSAAQLASGAAQAATRLAAPPGKAVAESAAFAARACAYNYADALAPILAARSAAAHIGGEAEASLWAEVGTDIETAQGLRHSNLPRSALWSNCVPRLGQDGLVRSSLGPTLRRGLGRLDRLVRAALAWWLAGRRLRTCLRERSSGGVGQGAGSSECMDTRAFAVAVR
jgi:hypothetical protein